MGEFCILGRSTGSTRILEEGLPLYLTTVAEGCFSSSCTQIFTRGCQVIPTGEEELTLRSRTCLATATAGEVACASDCLADHFVTGDCFIPALEAGTYTLRHGGLELQFTVPSEIPQEGLCIDSAL